MSTSDLLSILFCLCLAQSAAIAVLSNRNAFLNAAMRLLERQMTQIEARISKLDGSDK